MGDLQQKQSSPHSVAEEINPVTEGILEITLITPVGELLVLYETIVDFKNLKDNSFDFSRTLEFQGWNAYFERLMGPIYPVLVKQFWIHAVVAKDTIISYVMSKKFVVTEKSIADLIPHNGCGKRVYNVKTDSKREGMVASVIFKEGTKFDDGKGPSAKDLTDKLRVWFMVILGFIHHRPSTNSYDYINTTQKFMLFFLEKGFNLALLAILFKFSKDSIRETITRISSKKGKFISNERLI